MELERAQVAPKQVQKVPELGRLKSATERVARARGHVCTFLDKFHGTASEDPATGGGNTLQDTYRNDIDSLFSQIDLLEQTVAALEGIG